MKIEKIKPVPKYIVERIKQHDRNSHVSAPGKTRFYSYLTKNDGELVKITVAVRNHYKQWLYKQVAVHGLNSKECFVKDMIFYYIAGYQVGWYEQGLQKSEPSSLCCVHHSYAIHHRQDTYHSVPSGPHAICA